jgi:hypothetical protein
MDEPAIVDHECPLRKGDRALLCVERRLGASRRISTSAHDARSNLIEQLSKDGYASATGIMTRAADGTLIECERSN